MKIRRSDKYAEEGYLDTIAGKKTHIPLVYSSRHIKQISRKSAHIRHASGPFSTSFWDLGTGGVKNAAPTWIGCTAGCFSSIILSPSSWSVFTYSSWLRSSLVLKSCNEEERTSIPKTPNAEKVKSQKHLFDGSRNEKALTQIVMKSANCIGY